MLSISAVQPSAMMSPAAPTRPDNPSSGAGADSFSSTLMKAAQDVNNLQIAAADQSKAFVLGQTNDIHSVMIAAQKATVALELTTQVRNKVLEAYQSVMQMQM